MLKLNIRGSCSEADEPGFDRSWEEFEGIAECGEEVDEDYENEENTDSHGHSDNEHADVGEGCG